MTIRITGRTFDQREQIKALGGLWNGVERVWTLPDHTPEHLLNGLRNTPGIVIHMPGGDVMMPGKVDRPKREPVKIDWAGFGNEEHKNIVGNPTVHGNDQSWLGKFDKNSTAFFGFDSWSAMIDFIEAIEPGQRLDRKGWRTDNSEWAGTASMERAIMMARKGWPTGAEMAGEALTLLDAEHAQSRRRKHSVAGGKVNVGRMLAGSPDHMVHRPRQDGRKIITLLVDVWMSAGITAENAIIRAACVAAMCDVLESRGYSCEIVAVGSAFDTSRMQVATVVKQAGDALNILDVVFALGHPSMLRRFCFALAGIEPRLRNFWSSMGFQEAAFSDCDPGVFYISKLSGNLNANGFEGKVRKAFDLIVPDGFPIDLSE